MYDNINLAELKEFWESKKEYIEKDLWVIRNFLSEEELVWLNEETNNPEGWYTTMRSPYGGNIKNKFLGYVVEYDENGNMLLPRNNSKFLPTKYVDYINARMSSVVPDHFVGAANSLQSFFEVSEDQMIKELGYIPEHAMDWHYERDDSDDEDKQRLVSESKDKKVFSHGKITASYNIYINDNFSGGILEFKNKDYSIKPEAGMLVNVPLYKEFEHRVTRVIGGNRHTIYGRSWDSPEGKYMSTNEDC